MFVVLLPPELPSPPHPSNSATAFSCPISKAVFGIVWKHLVAFSSGLDGLAKPWQVNPVHPPYACFCISYDLRILFIFLNIWGRAGKNQPPRKQEYTADTGCGQQRLNYLLSGPCRKGFSNQEVVCCVGARSCCCRVPGGQSQPFYVRVLSYLSSDIGQVRSQCLCFSSQPEAQTHHPEGQVWRNHYRCPLFSVGLNGGATGIGPIVEMRLQSIPTGKP